MPGGKNIRVVELFAGVGGFRVGLETASPRFKTIWANQWEPGQAGQWAYKCYVANFQKGRKRANCSNEDIATVIDQVPEHDLLVGGFPCQDYSVASTGARGIEGKKGVLWWSINSIIRLRHPKFVLLENVDRLLKSPASQRGRDFGIILRCLHDEGYVVEWRVINAADYGETQRRRRTFIFAAREHSRFYNRLSQLNLNKNASLWLREKGFFAPAFPVDKEFTSLPKTADLEDYDDLLDMTERFTCKFYNAGIMAHGKIYTQELTSEFIAPQPLSSIVEQGNVEKRYFITGDKLKKWEYMKGAKKIQRKSKSTGFEYTFSEGPIAFPDPLNKPARTMLTSEGTSNRSTHVIIDPKTGKLRILTPLECERINGFPDNWTATGMPERQRYFIMGNALVVPLITKMGKRLLQV